MAYRRRDHWPTREQAEASISRTSMVKSFDPRIRKLFLQHTFRDLPSRIYPDASGVALTTPASQEIVLYSPNPIDLPPDEIPYHQYSSLNAFNAVKSIRTPKLFVMGEICLNYESDYLKLAKEDEYTTLESCGRRHLAPLEKPTFIAGKVSNFVGKNYLRWVKKREEDFNTPRYDGFHPLYDSEFGLISKKSNKKEIPKSKI